MIHTQSIPPTSPAIYRDTVCSSTDNPRYWTDIKIKQVSFYALSGISILSAGIIVGVSSSLCASLTAATPLVIISGAFYYYASTLVDYEDPHTLASLRHNASFLPLPEVIKKHGWEKLFHYEILGPSDFDTSYRNYAKTLSFKEILTFYKEAQKSLCQARKQNAYTLPSPSEWKEQFLHEVKDISCEEMVKTFRIADLETLNLVTMQQINILKQTENEIDDFNRKQSDLEDQFIERTNDERILFQNLREGARRSYQLHPSHIILLEIDNDTERAINFCRSTTRELIHQEDQSLEYFRELLMKTRNDQGLTAEDLNELALRERVKLNAITRIHENEYRTISHIQSQAMIRKIPIESSLAWAKKQKDLSINQAQYRFDQHTLPIRNEINELLNQNKKTYREHISALTNSYRETFSS